MKNNFMHVPKVKISALIITYNEIEYIDKCISSLAFADEIIVVDSYSNDDTYEYLKNHKRVNVLQKSFQNYTDQKSYTLEQANYDWVLFLDADEVITQPLEEEILKAVRNNEDTNAFWFFRQFMFKNEKLNYSGWQTDKNYRLFKKSKAKFSDNKLVHETLEIEGKSDILKEKMPHYCYKSYEDYKGKMLRYGQLKAKEAYYNEKRCNKIQMYLKTAWKFFHHYFIRLGFLDGKKGLTVCYLNALGVYESCRELIRLNKKNKLVNYLIMP